MAEFLFSDFSVRDDRCGQKVCSDSVLFAAWTWASHPAEGLVLDIGTGSGVLALLTARMCPRARVTAVELAPEACADARENFASSPWSPRLSLAEGSYESFDADNAEAIICNPPFFANGALSSDRRRADARHEGSLSYEGVVRYASRVLGDKGRLALMGPAEREAEVIFAAELAGLKAKRLARVRTSPRKDATRGFWEFSRADGPLSTEEIVIRNADGKYSDGYIALVGELYHHLKQ